MSCECPGCGVPTEYPFCPVHWNRLPMKIRATLRRRRRDGVNDAINYLTGNTAPRNGRGRVSA